MWSPYLRAISSKTEIISITSLVLFKNSSDLDSGRRPELKSDEFLKSTKLVIEIQRCENGAFPKRGYIYWDFESGVCPHGEELLDATEGGPLPSAAHPGA